jgi:Putative Ig domain
MVSSKYAAALRPRHRVLRAITFAALLSTASVAALATPSISGKPATSVTAAHYFAFQPSARNSSGGALSFAITNKPSWATFDTGTGRLYGTPLPQTNVGTFSNIVIAASAGGQRASLAPFAITVLPLPNTPPTLSGSPAPSVVAGRTYSFQPKATDPNGLKIGFSIWNKPSWASFNVTTGLLSGTPAASNGGTYSNIVITAYDGYSKAVLPAFNILVQAATSNPIGSAPGGSGSGTPSTTNGSATLSWTPPTQNANGSVLTNLAGYHIYYGTTPELGQSVTLANAGLTRYVLTGLTQATWYFAMTAYDSAGRESDRTAVATLSAQ